MRQNQRPSGILSRTMHVKPGLNPRGPSRKSKYSLVTDSEPSSASERWEEPRQGEDSDPETTCLQAVGAHLGGNPEGRRRAFCIMIRRLTVVSEVKPYCGGAEAKAGLNRTISWSRSTPH